MIPWLSLAWASPNPAEQMRLQEELARLVQKNAWAGVERVYVDLLAMEVPLACDVHLHGALAAKSEGRVTTEFRRLQRMVEPPLDGDPAVLQAWQVGQQELAALQDGFRFTAIHVGDPVPPTLVRPMTPFGQVERDAIAVARAEVAETRTFRGLLPVGDYVIGGQEVTVSAGPGWQVVTIGYP